MPVLPARALPLVGACAAAVSLLLQADVQDLVAHKAAVHGRYARARGLVAGVVHKADAPALPRALIQHHLRSTASHPWWDFACSTADTLHQHAASAAYNRTPRTCLLMHIGGCTTELPP